MSKTSGKHCVLLYRRTNKLHINTILRMSIAIVDPSLSFLREMEYANKRADIQKDILLYDNRKEVAINKIHYKFLTTYISYTSFNFMPICTDNLCIIYLCL